MTVYFDMAPKFESDIRKVIKPRAFSWRDYVVAPDSLPEFARIRLEALSDFVRTCPEEGDDFLSGLSKGQYKSSVLMALVQRFRRALTNEERSQLLDILSAAQPTRPRIK